MTSIKMSVDKVLNIAKSITTIRVYLPKNKKCVTKTMIMKRHQLFVENFRWHIDEVWVLTVFF